LEQLLWVEVEVAGVSPKKAARLRPGWQTRPFALLQCLQVVRADVRGLGDLFQGKEAFFASLAQLLPNGFVHGSKSG
jgi:hypothetical protein